MSCIHEWFHININMDFQCTFMNNVKNLSGWKSYNLKILQIYCTIAPCTAFGLIQSIFDAEEWIGCFLFWLFDDCICLKSKVAHDCMISKYNFCNAYCRTDYPSKYVCWQLRFSLCQMNVKIQILMSNKTHMCVTNLMIFIREVVKKKLFGQPDQIKI